MLESNLLGNTNINISKIGLGTVKFGRNTAVKYPKPFNLPTLNEIISLLEFAQDLGINTLDTAPAYGDSEQKLGEIFRKNSRLSRKNFNLITKAGEEFSNNQSHYNFDSKYINKSIDKSLTNLRTDYIDILLIHSDGNDQVIADNQELWSILNYRKQQGDIRAFGVSSKSCKGGLKCLAHSDLAMITYRQDYQDEQPILEYAQNNNKGIILKKVLNSGNSGNIPISDRIRFANTHPAVNSLIIGTINPKHLKECADAITNS